MSRRFLRASLALWKRRLAHRQRRLRVSIRHHRNNSARKWRKHVAEAEAMIARREKQLAAKKPLRLRALAQAEKLIGVMEQGGNNRGAEVEKIIREGGGLAGQAWCGWFAAAVYKRAGSRSVDWKWGAVRLLSLASGVRRTSNPQPGDLVRFTFDHVGLFVRDRGAFIETIEGNTGATGAVSDSKTGGDGVYRKRRPKSQVQDYLRVTR